MNAAHFKAAQRAYDDLADDFDDEPPTQAEVDAAAAEAADDRAFFAQQDTEYA